MPECSKNLTKAAYLGINQVPCFLFQCLQVDRKSRKNKTEVDVGGDMNNCWHNHGHIKVEDRACSPEDCWQCVTGPNLFLEFPYTVAAIRLHILMLS